MHPRCFEPQIFGIHRPMLCHKLRHVFCTLLGSHSSTARPPNANCRVSDHQIYSGGKIRQSPNLAFKTSFKTAELPLRSEAKRDQLNAHKIIIMIIGSIMKWSMELLFTCKNRDWGSASGSGFPISSFIFKILYLHPSIPFSTQASHCLLVTFQGISLSFCGL